MAARRRPRWCLVGHGQREVESWCETTKSKNARVDKGIRDLRLLSLSRSSPLAPPPPKKKRKKLVGIVGHRQGRTKAPDEGRMSWMNTSGTLCLSRAVPDHLTIERPRHVNSSTLVLKCSRDRNVLLMYVEPILKNASDWEGEERGTVQEAAGPAVEWGHSGTRCSFQRDQTVTATHRCRRY